MKLLVLSCFLAAAAAKPGILHSSAYSVAANSVTHPILPYAYTAPAITHHFAPLTHTIPHPIVAPIAPTIKTQYHAQDELGQASYGHTEPFQEHHAVQDAAGNKIGSYSYVAPNGQIIHNEYVADGFGYRSTSNANPSGPVAGSTIPVDTPEVIAARADHFAAHAAVKSRLRRSAQFYTPYATYQTPLLRAATHTTIVNTPGHAYSYYLH